MTKKNKRLLTGILIVLIFFLLVLVVMIKLPLPGFVAEAFLTAKANKFFPGCSIRVEGARFFILKGFEAEALDIIKDKQIVSSFKKFKVSYPASFLFSGTGRIKVASAELDIGMLSGNTAFLKFLSGILSDPQLKNRLVFDSFLLESDIDRGKIIVDNFNLRGKQLKIISAGSFERQKNIDFMIDVFLSDELTQKMSGGAREIFLEAQGDGFSKISFNICGSFDEPSFRIKTSLLELDIS